MKTKVKIIRDVMLLLSLGCAQCRQNSLNYLFIGGQKVKVKKLCQSYPQVVLNAAPIVADEEEQHEVIIVFSLIIML